MNNIILTTLNARYYHSSIGLRYLFSNLKEFQESTEIIEFIINDSINDIAEKILSNKPKIIGISVYIWNASEVKLLVDIIKLVSPDTIVVLGGPEVSHFPIRLDFSKADFIIQGEAEIEFYNLCKKIISNEQIENNIIKASPVDIEAIELPYNYYTEHDINTRVIYVEASRGCPFNCEFCLSSLDKKVRYFNFDLLLQNFENLWKRGARKFKFIDRTFNITIELANKILDYFLSKEPLYHLHFEVIPDHFPESLKEKIKLFPPATVQLEVGIQTLNPIIAENINRKLDIEKIEKNIKFLEESTNVHLHVDLIIGLPGETLESFGKNLDKLVELSNSEIQVGILKKLSGTALTRHDEIYNMVYSPVPPYDILQNNLIPYDEMQKMKRFARFWDLTYNSGNFSKTIHLLWKNQSVYFEFKKFSIWIYDETQSTWQISLARLSELLFNYLVNIKNIDKKEVAELLIYDFLKIKGRYLPEFLKEFSYLQKEIEKRELDLLNKRQIKRL